MTQANDAHAPDPEPTPAREPEGVVVPSVHHYFVDEAGDPVLFNAKGRVIAGTEGCSRFFILGNLDVAEPDRLADALNVAEAEAVGRSVFCRGAFDVTEAA